MNLLNADNISKSFADRTILEAVSFTIESGDKIGVIGVNGTGKSTLLRIVAGLETSDAGTITTAKGLRLEYLPQEPRFNDEMTVLEAVLHGSSPLQRLVRDYAAAEARLHADPQDKSAQKRFFDLSRQMDEGGAWSLEAEAKTMLTRLGIRDFDRRAALLSGGQQKRVALAGALMNPADLLLLDEPTNHLDPAAVEWLEQYLKNFKGALLMVTHDRYFLERVTNVMFEIEQTQLYVYAANYERWLELKAEREEREQAGWARHQNVLRRELAWMRQGAKARSTKQQARIQRFEELQSRSGPAEQAKLSIEAMSQRLGRKTLELRHVAKSWGKLDLFKDFSYVLARDERLGLIGPNGSGKTTLLNIFAGLIEPDSGEREVGSTVKIGYFRQENEPVDDSMRVMEYIMDTAESVQTAKGDLSASQMLELFLFPPSQQWNPIAKLSGGEKRRLYLLKVLMEQPNILLFDEPTNDLDIMTLSILENYLEDFPGAVIVVSHDRYFLDRVVQEILAFGPDGEIREFHGDFQAYLTQMQEGSIVTDQAARPKSEADTQAQPVKRKPDKLRLTMQEMRDLETIDARVAGLEAQLAEIDKQIEAAATDYLRLGELGEEQSALQKELEEATERWLYLQEKSEAIDQQKNQGE
ncbi:MAG: ABC transporter ATP-binding protein [Clostridia bacterium]|nr:ABC transporter ATP-binding protein [Clostridia bacterium]